MCVERDGLRGLAFYINGSIILERSENARSTITTEQKCNVLTSQHYVIMTQSCLIGTEFNNQKFRVH